MLGKRILRLCKIVLVAASAGVLAACTTVEITRVVGEAGTVQPNGATFDVVPLDFAKASQLDYQSLRGVVIQELTKRGMTPVNPVQTAPRYLVLFDYAVDLGVNASYERRFVSVVYDPQAKAVIHKMRLTSEGETKAPIEIFPSIIRGAYSDFPSGAGVQRLTVPLQK